MATLAELKTRIILELNRSDLGSGAEMEQGLTDAITDAVEEHADELFWFNRKSGTVATTPGSVVLAPVSAMRLVTQLSYNYEALTKVSLEEIQYRYNAEGVPTHWAPNEGNLILWPTPDAAYDIEMYGVEELGVPASASSNHWTTTALQLTKATAKEILCRDYLRDPDGEAAALRAKATALTKLRRETRRRRQRPLMTEIPGAGGFNIFAGD